MMFPGSFFAEEITERVENAHAPKSLPRDCYGYYFDSVEYVIDGKKEYKGASKRMGPTTVVGIAIDLADIPDRGPRGEDNTILKRNIEWNSPTKRGIKTNVGNWQWEDDNHIAVPPCMFTFTEPRIYKNFKGVET